MKSNDYTMEELLPIVAKLAAKYTSNESSSLTYERAEQLMEAVLYCIREQPEAGLLAERLPAQKAYELGYQRVVQKVRGTIASYNRLARDFQDYENENYRDTVLRALPGFFRHYDARFAPQETIITMDYPTIGQNRSKTGIDAIAEYVDQLTLEQRFLQKLSPNTVKEILSAWHSGYREQYSNLCEVVLSSVLRRLLAKSGVSPEKQTREQTEELLRVLLRRLIDEGYGGDERLYHHLAQKTGDIAFTYREGRHE